MPRSLYAFANLIWSAHKLGLAGMIAYWLFTTAVVVGLPKGSLSPSSAVPLVYFPLLLSSVYLLSVFSFSANREAGTADSGYPGWMLRLPLKASKLAGWPMALGAAALALLWLPQALATLPRLSSTPPLVWPLAFAVSTLVWMQVASWWPCRGIVLRCLIFIGLLLVATGLPSMLLLLPAGESWFALALGAAALAAPWLGSVAVDRARGGEVLQLRLDPWPRWMPGLSPPLRGGPLAALAWHDWRRVAMAIPGATLLLALLVVGGLPVAWALEGQAPQPERLLLVVLGSPLFAGFLVGQLANRFDGLDKSSRVPGFLAIRPVRSYDLVRAKWLSAAFGSLGAWAIAVSIDMLLAAGAKSWEQLPLITLLFRDRSALSAVGAVIAWAMLLLGATWLAVVANLCLGFTGRPWLANAVSLFPAFLIITGVYGAEWGVLHLSQWQPGFQRLAPTLALGWLGLKLCLACGVASAVARRGLMTSREVAALASAWAGGVLGATALLLFAVPPWRDHAWVVLQIVALMTPLARLLVCPWALAWNRHR